ncbi:hypothetical protein EB796_011751 [Bugula neritina]|uniref:Small ribosomal subunit protein mS23 conserved domain-containing protein n=1 Tax=Bugula neritina TaxID=10212 RepID=A0A7J7JW49_BUGNE|nr:hypothetical protein EB796_011751 [Bugula neritina]
MERPTPPSKVKNLIYPEDYIRGNFMKTYDHKNTKYVRLDDSKTLTDHVMDKYVNCFIEVSQRDDGKDAKEVVAAVEAMLANDGLF